MTVAPPPLFWFSTAKFWTRTGLSEASASAGNQKTRRFCRWLVRGAPKRKFLHMTVSTLVTRSPCAYIRKVYRVQWGYRFLHIDLDSLVAPVLRSSPPSGAITTTRLPVIVMLVITCACGGCISIEIHLDPADQSGPRRYDSIWCSRVPTIPLGLVSSHTIEN
jgi:hypothetical protein